MDGATVYRPRHPAVTQRRPQPAGQGCATPESYFCEAKWGKGGAEGPLGAPERGVVSLSWSQGGETLTGERYREGGGIPAEETARSKAPAELGSLGMLITAWSVGWVWKDIPG